MASRRSLGRAGRELVILDQAVYSAVAATPTPTLDAAIARISNAANQSRLWLSIAAVMSLRGGRTRRAALVGVAAIAVTSGVVNLAVKPVLGRQRPSRHGTVRTHSVRMPRSTSSPSGHAASAFAFSCAAGGSVPALDSALRLMATTVAYSRVHTGVHYPGDVIVGGLIGAGAGTLTRQAARRVGFIRR